MGLLVFTRYPSEPSQDQSLPTTLECQAQPDAVLLSPNLHLALSELRALRKLTDVSCHRPWLQVVVLLRGLQLGGELIHRSHIVEGRQVGVAGEGVAFSAVHKNFHFQNVRRIGGDSVDE